MNCIFFTHCYYCHYFIKIEIVNNMVDLKVCDYIVDINGQNVSRATHKSVKKLINK